MNWNELLSTHRLGGTGDSTPNPVEVEEPWTQFDADYGRAVFSAPVRRLQDKAQVFPMDPTDAVRTRLTHSMEVSSVARGLARRIANDEKKAGHLESIDPRSIETVVGTSSLLHDLGNPPFGHAGEGAMQDWFNRKLCQEPTVDKALGPLRSDFLKFEGNAQTLRLVSRLQLLIRNEGLNLTCATLAALQKYVTGADATDESKNATHATKKPGFFASERQVVNEFRDKTGMPGGARNPMALLMEAADDICFAIVDIEDGIKKGVTTWAKAKNAIEGAGETGQRILKRVRKYMNDHDDGGLEGSSLDQAKVQFLRVSFIKEGVGAAQKAFEKNRMAIFMAVSRKSSTSLELAVSYSKLASPSPCRTFIATTQSSVSRCVGAVSFLI